MNGVVVLGDGFTGDAVQVVLVLNVLLVLLGAAVAVKNLLRKPEKDLPQPLHVTSPPGSPVVTRKAADDVSLREFTDVKGRVETVHEILEEHRKDSAHKHDDIQARISALAVSLARMESSVQLLLQRTPRPRGGA